MFPRRVLLLVFVFQRGVFEDERKDNDTRGTHVNAVGEFNHGEFSRVHERRIDLTDLDGRGEDASGVEDAESGDIGEAEDDESENEDGAHKWSAVKTKNNRKGCEVVSRVNTRRRNEEKAKALGFWTVAKEVYDTSGVAGFYGGLSASLIMVANPALQFAFYETLRQKQQRSSSSSSSSSNNNSTISALEAFVLGATAKIGATLATYPMLVIKSRLQVGRREVLGTKKNTIKATTDDKNEGEKKEYDGIVDCMKDLYTNEGGFFAFYDGLTTKLSQTALCAALMFSSKEEISRRVDEMAMSILQRYGNSKTM